jgi:hypothetical protein
MAKSKVRKLKRHASISRNVMKQTKGGMDQRQSQRTSTLGSILCMLHDERRGRSARGERRRDRGVWG